MRMSLSASMTSSLEGLCLFDDRKLLK